MKIAELKKILDATAVEQLPEVIASFADEESAGAKQQLLRAKKRYDAYVKECERTENMQIYERKYNDYHAICGIDEVGRGPLAGLSWQLR